MTLGLVRPKGWKQVPLVKGMPTIREEEPGGRDRRPQGENLVRFSVGSKVWGQARQLDYSTWLDPALCSEPLGQASGPCLVSPLPLNPIMPGGIFGRVRDNKGLTFSTPPCQVVDTWSSQAPGSLVRPPEGEDLVRTSVGSDPTLFQPYTSTPPCQVADMWRPLSPPIQVDPQPSEAGGERRRQELERLLDDMSRELEALG